MNRQQTATVLVLIAAAVLAGCTGSEPSAPESADTNWTWAENHTTAPQAEQRAQEAPAVTVQAGETAVSTVLETIKAADTPRPHYVNRAWPRQLTTVEASAQDAIRVETGEQVTEIRLRLQKVMEDGREIAPTPTTVTNRSTDTLTYRDLSPGTYTVQTIVTPADTSLEYWYRFSLTVTE